jgi:hypothetical protein
MRRLLSSIITGGPLKGGGGHLQVRVPRISLEGPRDSERKKKKGICLVDCSIRAVPEPRRKNNRARISGWVDVLRTGENVDFSQIDEYMEWVRFKTTHIYALDVSYVTT